MGQLLHFNSTMVRLKGQMKEYFRAFWQNFNSTMVRLKGILILHLLHFLHYFNSTMVRLKEGLHSFVTSDNTIFQFHYGSIKSK